MCCRIMFIFIGESRIGWRLRKNMGRLTIKPPHIAGNISLPCNRPASSVTMVYILNCYVMEWVQENGKIAPDR